MKDLQGLATFSQAFQLIVFFFHFNETLKQKKASLLQTHALK